MSSSSSVPLHRRLSVLPCLLLPFVTIGVLAQAVDAAAQQRQNPLPAATPQPSPAAVPNRLPEVIDPSPLQALPNHVPSWASPRNNTGLANSDLALTLVLSRSPQQQADLEKLLADQKNPSSPDFHHWLTPTEMGERFGLSDSDLQAVKGWIQSQGMRVNWVAPSRTFISFGGPAATVGRAFATEIHNYRVDGADRVSVSSAPMIPAALAPAVKSVFGLYTIPDRPMHAVTAPQTALPSLTLSNGSHYIAPADFMTIYDGDPLVYNGANQTIGIVARSRINSADISNFEILTFTSFQSPTEVVPTAFGGVDPGPALTAPPTTTSAILGEQLEATLDVTRAGSVAHGANLLLVTASVASGGIEDDAQYLVQTSPVPAQIINISYGDCESDGGPSGVNFWDTLFQQAAAEGISVFVSSGDSGAAGCEQSFVAPSANPAAISPNYICSSSYATCVGGTEFNDTSSPGKYWNPSTAGNSEQSSALSYIPEGGWNEPTDASGNTQLASSGGGVSSIIASPSWQTGPGVPSAKAGRYTPDLSFSSSCHDGYFGCMAAAGGDCVSTNGGFRFVYFCGTSAAAPGMAGLAAILNQKTTYPVGNMNPEIYAMGQNQPTSFHDATPATSGVGTCAITTPSMCNNSTPGPIGLTGGQAGYPLTAGYDLVTGWGSPDITNFVTNFATALPLPTVTLTPSPATIGAEQPITITVVVAGATGQPTPTGTVSLTWGPVIPLTATLSNGTASFSIPAGVLPGGANATTFRSQFTPATLSTPVYSQATGTCSVPVTLFNPTVAVAFSPAAPTTAQVITATVTVAGVGSNPTPTGWVALGSGTQYFGIQPLAGGSASVTVPAGVLAPGSAQFTANYSTDYPAGLYYAAATGSANLTITAAPKTTPAVSAVLASSTVTLADTAYATVTVAGAAGGPIPTGSGSVAVNGHTISYPLFTGSAQIPFSAAWLNIGTNSLAIGYSGDYNYNPATTAATITATRSPAFVTVMANLPSITTAQSLTVNIGLLGVNMLPAPTGTITLTSGTYASAATPLGVPTTIIVPANALAVGTDTLTATYSGDSTYLSASATTSVVVTAPPPPPPSFTVGGTAVTISAPGTTTGNTSTITVTPAGGFTGSVTLTATLASSPSGAQYLPTFSFGTSSPVSVTAAGPATATLTVSTTAPTTGALRPAARPGAPWYPMGETALAGILLVGFRARRRGWRVIAGSLLLLVAFLSALLACGGGGSSGTTTPPPTPTPGTTAGTYSVTVTDTSAGTSATTAVTLVVQ